LRQVLARFFNRKFRRKALHLFALSRQQNLQLHSVTKLRFFFAMR